MNVGARVYVTPEQAFGQVIGVSQRNYQSAPIGYRIRLDDGRETAALPSEVTPAQPMARPRLQVIQGDKH